MKSKDVIILNKILDYCRQLDEACDMFDNDYNNFVGNSVFQNACCMCILQIGELCKVISEELRMQEKVVPWKEWCGIRDHTSHKPIFMYHVPSKKVIKIRANGPFHKNVAANSCY